MANHGDPTSLATQLSIILGVVVLVTLIVLIVKGATHLADAQSEVEKNCLKTDLIYFEGNRAEPSYIYDCTGIDLKGTKK